MKTLYFEGAGWEKAESNGVGNCRIRTAFTNNDGKKIFLEILQGYKGKEKNAINWIAVDSCFYITDNKEIDDCDESRLIVKHYNRNEVEYTRENILNYVNKQCNCSFDEIVVLNDLSGYRVFTNKNKNTFQAYNYGDEFQYDSQLEMLRVEINDYYYELEKSEGKQYPNFSLWVDEDDKHLLHLLRHFNGYNKHWSIRTDNKNWKDTVKETKLGKYAC